ncbi:hypothetical protein [Tritonibacter horizontis]|uniref:Uncharacterized protein n=1 Tax=Tritonibacter horizontis TaxID=1768241 RepID=A0A132BSF9_9RHOB|nr:hypothetical protein [Tritonibacter horizontis]KUP91301.1 hypothetical protein TRIHO_38750 [Tritonibacter horizontis]
MAVLRTLHHTIAQDWQRMLLSGLLFAVLFQVLMLLALMIRFQALPNYVVAYDWIGNVIHIVKSTPSWRDIPPIINQEWLLEVGKINYEYGTGISEWSLNVVPVRMMVLFVLGLLVALCTSLQRRDTCTAGPATTLRAATGIGTILVAMTNATMSWVVCCAAPSWVVGLAMLGLGVATSLALETMGPALNIAGFGLLSCTVVFLAWRKTRAAKSQMGAPSHA